MDQDARGQESPALLTEPAEYGSEEMLQDPYPFFEYLRQQCPVYKVPGQDDFYLLAKAEDIVFAARHPELFTNTGRGLSVEFPGQRYKSLPDLASLDPPDHTEMRAAISRLLTPARMRQYRPMMQRETDFLIDQFIDEPEIEFIMQFAWPLPARVIGAVLGIEEDLYPQLKTWADDYLQLFDSNLHGKQNDEKRQRLIASFVEFQNFCGDAIASRREHAREDGLTELALSRKADGSLFSVDVLANNVRNLIMGGQETTTYLMANTLIAVVRSDEPGDMQDERYLMRVFDESLRHEAPAGYGPRRTTEDVELNGVTIPAGARVFLAWQSGNRDEDVFECPAEFRVDRPNLKRQLGFGIGIHFCVGAPLSRTEAAVAFMTLFRRFREIRLSPKNDYRFDTHLTSLRPLKELHLELERA